MLPARAQTRRDDVARPTSPPLAVRHPGVGLPPSQETTTTPASAPTSPRLASSEAAAAQLCVGPQYNATAAGVWVGTRSKPARNALAARARPDATPRLGVPRAVASARTARQARHRPSGEDAGLWLALEEQPDTGTRPCRRVALRRAWPIATAGPGRPVGPARPGLSAVEPQVPGAAARLLTRQAGRTHPEKSHAHPSPPPALGPERACAPRDVWVQSHRRPAPGCSVASARPAPQSAIGLPPGSSARRNRRQAAVTIGLEPSRRKRSTPKRPATPRPPAKTAGHSEVWHLVEHLIVAHGPLLGRRRVVLLATTARRLAVVLTASRHAAPVGRP